MLRNLIALLCLCVCVPQVFATKARLVALGDDKDGSYIINDDRNIFINPAYLAKQSKYITFEWGAPAAALAASATASNDTDISPRVEGGFFGSYSKMAYGLYLGAQDEIGTIARAKSIPHVDSTGVFLYPDDQINAFIAGGSSDIFWGLSLARSKSKNDQLDGLLEQELLTAQIGVLWNQLSISPTLYIKDKAVGTTDNSNGEFLLERDEFRAKFNYNVSIEYELPFVKVYGFFHRHKWESRNKSNIASESQIKEFRFGAAKKSQLAKNTFLFSRVELRSLYEEHKLVDNALVVPAGESQNLELEFYEIPITFGLEHQLFSWMQLRCSVSQELMGQTTGSATDITLKGKDTSNLRTTRVNAGLGVQVKDFELDGLIGTTSGATAATVASGAQTGVLSTDRLLTRVGLKYKF